MAKDQKGHGSNARGAILRAIAGPAPGSGSSKEAKEFRRRARELEGAYLSAKPGKAQDAAKKAMHDHLDSWGVRSTTQNKKY